MTKSGSFKMRWGSNGQDSLNYQIDDMRKFQAEEIKLEPENFMVSEDEKTQLLKDSENDLLNIG